jgi:hypothetical protein
MISAGTRPRITNKLTRGFVCLLGVGAIVWALFVLPIFWRQASPQAFATKLLYDDSFRLQSLLDETQQAEKAVQHRFCVPTALRSLFVLRFFILNKAISDSNRVLVESSYAPLLDAALNALSCAPEDPFVWLTLFWLDAGKNGLNARNDKYLRLSYALGPNEGWIALWRIRLALLLFDRLPPDLSSEAVHEFIRLVNAGWLYWETAEIFKDASAAAQSRITEQLKTLNLSTRQAFARTLHNKGVDVDIPGVEKPTRPWQ